MKKVLWITSVLLISCLALFPQSGTKGKGKMKGRILDEKTGTPIEGVTIKFYSIKAQAFHQEAKSDANGEWRSLFMRSGLWNVDFEKVGYEPKKISVTVSEDSGAKVPDIEMKMRKMEGAAMDENVVKEIEKANVLLGDKKFNEAIAAYQVILEKNKDNPNIHIVYSFMGNAYSGLENYEKAIEYYQKVFEKNKTNVEVIISIGNCYNNLKQNEKAMEWFEKVPFEEINNRDTLFNIGILLYNSGKNDGAEKYFAKSVTIDPEFADGFYYNGMCLIAQNKVQECITNLEKFMQLAPDSPNFATAKAIVDAYSPKKK